MIWHSEEIKKIKYGEVLGDWQANGICIDTRKIYPKEIFTAFKGQQVDGHRYISEAIKKGAGAIIANYVPDNLDEKYNNFWIVDDVEEAIKKLADYNRKRTKAKIIGITGSVGKTSVKEATALMLSEFGNTFYSKGNYNNNLGTPISVASMPEDTEYAVFEMGMSGLGEIDYLTNIVKPHIAIITHVAPVHIESLGSIENIARAKSEIYNSMNSEGVAICNGDISTLNIIKEKVESKSINQFYKFGVTNKDNDATILSFEQKENASDIKALISGEEISLSISARGEHMAQNMLPVLLVAKLLDLDLKKASKKLAEFRSVSGRGETSEITFQNKKILLIDEAYNSGPVSLKAALNVLGGLPLGQDWKRKVVVLSDMRELGDISKQEHQNISSFIKENNVQFAILVGDAMRDLYDKLKDDVESIHFKNKDEAKKQIDGLLLDRDIVLVKGSFGTKIYEVIEYLKGI